MVPKLRCRLSNDWRSFSSLRLGARVQQTPQLPDVRMPALAADMQHILRARAMMCYACAHGPGPQKRQPDSARTKAGD